MQLLGCVQCLLFLLLGFLISISKIFHLSHRRTTIPLRENSNVLGRIVILTRAMWKFFLLNAEKCAFFESNPLPTMKIIQICVNTVFKYDVSFVQMTLWTCSFTQVERVPEWEPACFHLQWKCNFCTMQECTVRLLWRWTIVYFTDEHLPMCSVTACD